MRVKKDRGLTLMELLVALAMSSILIAALYRTFVGQQKTYTVQEEVVDMQQNVRVAVREMVKEIRMAGFGNVDMVLPVTFGAVTFNNILNPDTPGANSITIVSALENSATVTAVPAKNQIIVSSVAGFDTGDKRYISIGGLESHIITNVDSTSGTLTLSENLIYNPPVNTPVFGIRAITYQVVTPAGGTPTLMRNDNMGGSNALADNIGNLQFQYFDGNGVATALPAAIRMVQVTATARTNRTDPDLVKTQTNAGYRTRTVASNIQVRNLK